MYADADVENVFFHDLKNSQSVRVFSDFPQIAQIFPQIGADMLCKEMYPFIWICLRKIRYSFPVQALFADNSQAIMENVLSEGNDLHFV